MLKERQDQLAALWARYLRLVEELEGPGGPDGLDRLEALLTSPEVQRLWEECVAEEGRGKGAVDRLEYKSLRLPYAVKAVDDATRTIRGYGAAYTVDLGGDEIEPGAFADTLVKARDTAKARGTTAWWPMLYAHDRDRVVGAWTHAREDTKGLVMEGRIDTSFNDGRQAWSLVKQGIGGLSIGYRPRRVQQRGRVRCLKQVDLIEVSLTAFPMNPEARVTSHD